MRKVLRYATGEKIPEGAVYLWSCKNGNTMLDQGNGHACLHPDCSQNVWHYFLVDVIE